MMTYNDECTNLPQVKVISDARKKAIKKFQQTFTLEQFGEICRVANESEFLTGNNDRGWKADFDFLLRVDKATSILEGKYSGKTSGFKTNNPFMEILEREGVICRDRT